MDDARPARWPAWAWAVVAFFGVVAACGAGYGYHRDELYFLEAGRHPA